MDTRLFTERSIWTMVHGIVLGGGALMALFAVLFSLRAMRPVEGAVEVADEQARYLGWLTILATALLWLTVLLGTYITFPPYRATPPEGLTDLSRYPRSLIQSNPGTAWLHSFAMELKEHVPWIAAMLSSAIAFVTMRYRAQVLRDASLRNLVTTLVAICFLLVSVAALLGTFVNKVAPLD
ncbi:MAG TPA: hypothetical protein VK864_20630 [Longimicrobiales bacterium]|nr:hypothetical protein [Longimicrobiales bacterium]